MQFAISKTDNRETLLRLRHPLSRSDSANDSFYRPYRYVRHYGFLRNRSNCAQRSGIFSNIRFQPFRRRRTVAGTGSLGTTPLREGKPSSENRRGNLFPSNSLSKILSRFRQHPEPQRVQNHFRCYRLRYRRHGIFSTLRRRNDLEQELKRKVPKLVENGVRL